MIRHLLALLAGLLVLGACSKRMTPRLPDTTPVPAAETSNAQSPSQRSNYDYMKGRSQSPYF